MVRLEEISRLSEKVVKEFQPDRVILVGSHAYGNAGPYSDVNLLVVIPFEGRNFWKALEILNRVDPPFPVDLLARRPDDTARRHTEGDPLIREAWTTAECFMTAR